MPGGQLCPAQDGYYYIVMDCLISTHSLPDTAHCSGSGVSLLVSGSSPPCLTLFCPVLPHFICPGRVQEGECQFELEDCLEEVWVELGLKGGKDLGMGGTRSIEKRLGGSQPAGRGGGCAGERGREGWGVMEGSPSFLRCFSPCGHHCSSKDEFALEGTRIERVLWVSHAEPRCVSPCPS